MNLNGFEGSVTYRGRKLEEYTKEELIKIVEDQYVYYTKLNESREKTLSFMQDMV